MNRLYFPGAQYHLVCRGIRKMPIFDDLDDFKTFMIILKKAKDETGFTLHAYCLMTNHIHLQMTVGDIPIWSIMQRILGSYAKTYNARHGYSGHLFEGRYLSTIIRDPRYMLAVNRYIHLNPVRAGIVDKPEDYIFSSFRSYIGAVNPWIESSDEIMACFNDFENPRNAYQDFVNIKMA